MKSLAVLFALLAISVAASAQVPATGRLLVSTPAIGDLNFDHTVILLIHHSEEGSLGLFLNRPTWVDGGEAFPELEGFERRTRTLDFGGPIALTRLLALVADPAGTEGLTDVADGIYLTADITALAGPDGALRTPVRIFAGHAAWGPEQLQEEIDDGFWRVVNSSMELVFEMNPEELWNAVADLDSSGLTAAVTIPF